MESRGTRTNQLAASAGRRLDEACPFVDARLAGGARLHCVLPPVAVNGTLISIRVPRRRAFSLDDLIARDTMDESTAGWLTAIIRGRLAFLVCGGTGSGKTTILSTMLGLVPEAERLVVVEDSTELTPRHPHVVSLQARTSNVEGSGAVTLRDLVRQALRMRPDRIVVGEVRGAEVVELLASMNTGHEGGCGTIHANSAADVPADSTSFASFAARSASNCQKRRSFPTLPANGSRRSRRHRRNTGSRTCARPCALQTASRRCANLAR